MVEEAEVIAQLVAVDDAVVDTSTQAPLRDLWHYSWTVYDWAQPLRSVSVMEALMQRRIWIRTGLHRCGG